MAEQPSDEAVFGVETIHLDLPAVVSAMGQRLNAAGVPVTPERSANFAEALTLTKPVSRRRLYCTARAVFVSSQAHIPAFDAVFAALFGRKPDSDSEEEPDLVPTDSESDDRPAGEDRPEPPPSEPDPTGMDTSSPPGEDEDDDDDAVEVPIAEASEEEQLGEKSFAALEPHELAALYQLMTRLSLATPVRRTRRTRHVRRRGEQIDMRRTLRGSLRTAGDPIRLHQRRRRVHRRRLVLLCDISGSMEPYARAYLQFLHCAAGSGPDAEAFAFATRLTRLTRALAGRNPERAIARAAAAAPDWSSGTRIGDALKTFNDRHGRRGMARGAVVVILSDGWERGDPALVQREMERLSRLAYRIVWVNPRVSAAEFTPKAGGMAAALPYCNALVSGHTLKALGEVADAIRADLVTDACSLANWKPPTESSATEVEDEPWASAEPTEDPVPMPSGYSPSQGNTTS